MHASDFNVKISSNPFDFTVNATINMGPIDQDNPRLSAVWKEMCDCLTVLENPPPLPSYSELFRHAADARRHAWDVLVSCGILPKNAEYPISQQEFWHALEPAHK
jgi:hypothetical protein